jgi:hypothetical protein
MADQDPLLGPAMRALTWAKNSVAPPNGKNRLPSVLSVPLVHS